MNATPTFGQIVRERRIARDLTQVELARRVGCATVTIRKIEYDTLRPSVQIAERLAMALLIPLEERAAFIRLGRAALQDTPDPSPLPTPPPTTTEIGQADLSGRAVRGYALGERIGHGGFGAVYRAVQPVVEREVAVKIILPKYANHPDFIRRFEAEAQIIARIEHPFIVPLYDYWREPDAAYLVMRLLRGGSLETLLQAGPLTLAQAIRHLEQLGSALHAAHRVGIIHRDIKPANILLDDDANSYLADFGIAKNLGNPNLNEQTAVGAMVGSPAYISPEQIMAEPVRPQADIYCLGLLFYEMLTGQKAFPGPTPVAYIQQHLNNPLPALAQAELAQPLPPALDDVIARATAKDPHGRYPDVLAFLADVQTAVSSQNGPSITAAPTLTPEELAGIDNPYKGLRPFGIGDSGNFFGRDAMVQELLSRLAESDEPPGAGSQGLARFLSIVGPSGSGKSSVVKAGLVPALRQGGVPGSENWFMVDMMPGPHPLEELEAALLRVAVNPPDSLLAQLRSDERGLIRAAKRILPADHQTELLLIIDQFEEIFTLVEDESDRTHFLSSLVTAVVDPRSRIRVVITLRADFTDRPLRYVDFGELVHKRTEFILPLSPDELEQVITKPAQQCSIFVEPELVATMIHDVADQPGVLPLLQYTLTELFDRRNGRDLTLTAYHDIGGIAGALAHRADEIYDRLDGADQTLTHQLFLRLVTLGDGVGDGNSTPDTRRRVLLSELNALETGSEGVDKVLEAYGRSRLLTFDHDPITREPTVEVAHEALLREWGRLRSWLEESRYDIRRQRLLAAAAAQWANAGQDDSYLLHGNRLTEFAAWVESIMDSSNPIALTRRERLFLDASLVARNRRQEEEQARQRRELETAQQLAETERKRAEEQTLAAQRLRRRAFFLVGALVLAALLAVAAVVNGNRATQNAAEAQNNLALAVSREAEAVANVNLAATQEALAIENAALAATREAEAEASARIAETRQAEAESETLARSEAEAVAIHEREAAEQQARIAFSRELAAASLYSLDNDPELSILLALEGLSQVHTIEAEEALHQAIQGARVRQALRPPENLPAIWLRYNPDGSRLFTAGINGGTMWDMTTGEVVFTRTLYVSPDLFEEYFPGDQPELFADLAAFSPDGALLALPVEELINGEWRPGYIAILDAETGEDMLLFPAHESGIGNVAFNQNGTQLASTTLEGGQVIIWDIPSTLTTGVGQEITSLCCHDDFVWSLSYSPDGTRIVTTSADDSVRVWEVATGREILGVNADGPHAAVFTLDGQNVAVGGEREVLIVDAASGEIRSSAPGPGTTFYDLRFSPDGTRLAASNFDANIRIWKYGAGELELNPLILSGHKASVGGISFSPDGRYLASGSSDGTARVWDVSMNGSSESGTYAHDNRVIDVAFSPDGRWLVSTSVDGTAKIWDTAVNEVRFTLDHDDWVVGVAIHPDGRTLATSSNDGTVHIWDAVTGEEQQVIQAHETVNFGYIRGAKGISYSPDGLRLATGGADRVVRVWDLATGEELFMMTGHTGTINAVAYSPDGRWIVSAGDDGTIRVWDAADGRARWTLSDGQEITFEALFSPDGSRLVTGHDGGWVVIWSIPEPGADPASRPEKVGQFQPRPQAMAKGVFSPDGNLLVIAGPIETSILNVQTGELLVNLGHPATKATFTLDGQIVATAGNDGMVRLFVIDQAALVTLARSRVTRELTAAECQQYLHVETCPDGN